MFGIFSGLTGSPFDPAVMVSVVAGSYALHGKLGKKSDLSMVFLDMSALDNRAQLSSDGLGFTKLFTFTFYNHDRRKPTLLSSLQGCIFSTTIKFFL